MTARPVRLGLRHASRQDLLAIYLNDHLAGSTAGEQLVKRCLGSNRDGALGDDLRQLLSEVGEDRRVLVEVMGRAGVAADRVKRALAVGAERVARLKPNGQLLGYSDLSRLAELEGLSLAVEGRRSLWRTLSHLSRSDPRLAGPDYDRLVERAERQRELLDRHRLAAAERALSRAPGTTGGAGP